MGIDTSRKCYIIVGPEDEKRLSESAEGRAPRLDYRELAQLVNGTIVEGTPPPTMFRVRKPLAVLRSMIPNLIMTRRLIHEVEDGSIILSTGETWGIPCGLMLRLIGRPRVRHYVYLHRVFSSNWRRFLRLFGPHLAIDGWFCVTSKQKRVLREDLGEGALIEVVSQGVDTRFFSPEQAVGSYAGARPYVLAVGAEMRDFSLFFKAVGALDVLVMVRASSSWMANQRKQIARVPSNVKLIENRLSYCQLRELYAGAAVVVVPLLNTLQAAGITTILEAMAMRKIVIATRSEGLPDLLRNAKTGIIVEATANNLARAIEETLSLGEEGEAMVRRARACVEERANLESFATRIAAIIAPNSLK